MDSSQGRSHLPGNQQIEESMPPGPTKCCPGSVSLSRWVEHPSVCGLKCQTTPSHHAHQATFMVAMPGSNAHLRPGLSAALENQHRLDGVRASAAPGVPAIFCARGQLRLAELFHRNRCHVARRSSGQDRRACASGLSSAAQRLCPSFAPIHTR